MSENIILKWIEEFQKRSKPPYSMLPSDFLCFIANAVDRGSLIHHFCKNKVDIDKDKNTGLYPIDVWTKNFPEPGHRL